MTILSLWTNNTSIRLFFHQRFVINPGQGVEPVLRSVSRDMLNLARFAKKSGGKVYRFAGEGQSLLMTSEQGI